MVVGVNRGEIVCGGSDGFVQRWRSVSCCELWLSVGLLVVE